MRRRRKTRADGTPVPRSACSPRPPPTPEALEELDALTEGFPPHLRAFRDLELLSPARRLAIEQALANRSRSLCLVLHGIHDPHNQAALMRTSEAMGLQEIHIVTTATAPFRPNERVTRSADRWIDVMVHASFEEAAAVFARRGMRMLAAAMVDNAVPLHAIDATAPTALVLGTEARGLPPDVIEACDGAFVIPMYGFTTSFNVSVAGGMALSHAVETRRRAWGRPGDLSDLDRMSLRTRFYAKAAKRVPPSIAARLGEPACAQGLEEGE